MKSYKGKKGNIAGPFQKHTAKIKKTDNKAILLILIIK